MKDDDQNELGKILSPLRGLRPDDLQLRRWSAAVQAESTREPGLVRLRKSTLAWQLSVAASVGFAIGAVFFGYRRPDDALSYVTAQNFDTDATFERSHSNLD